MGSGPINIIPDAITSLVRQIKQGINQPLTKKGPRKKEVTKHERPNNTNEHQGKRLSPSGGLSDPWARKKAEVVVC
jgi:hypothetical protein